MKKTRIKVLWAAKTKYPKSWGIKAHRHDCYQLFFIMTGSCRYVIDGTLIDLNENDYIIVYPNVEHAMLKNHDDLVKMVDIKFTINETLLADRLKNVKFYGETPEAIRTFFKLISNEFRNQNEYYNEVVEAYTTIMLLKLLSSSWNCNPYLNIQENLGDEYSKLCLDVAHYLDTHYQNEITLDDVANTLGYNKNYLCTLFKSKTTQTIMDYLRRLRIEKACELIEMSDYTFSQISYMVGFKSIHHFNHVFKNLLSLTPGEYKMGLSDQTGIMILSNYKNEDNYDTN